MAEKDLLKTIIRSILTSTPRDTTIDQLWKEYRESEGREFPYAALGYKSFWEYLKSIPDVVKLEQMPYGSTVVRPVASDKSAHIEKLVMNQRISVPSRNSRKRSNARRRRSAIAKLPDKSYVGVKSIPSLLDTKYMPPSMSSSHSSSPPLTPDTRHSESSDSKCSMNQEAYDSCEDLEVRLDQVTYPYDDGNVDPLGRRVFLKNGVETTVDELSEGIRFSKGKSPTNEAASNSNIHGLNVFLSDWSKLEPRGITSPAKPEFVHNRVQLIPRCIELGAPEVHAAGPQHKRIVNEIRHRNYEALVMTIKMSSRLYVGSESCNKIIIPNEVVDKLLNLLEKNSEGMRVCDIGRRLVVSQKTIDRLSDLNINSVDDILRNLDEYVTVSGDKVFPKIIISSKPNGLNCVPYGSDYECSGSALNGRNSVCSGSSNECTINGTLVTNLKVILQENPRGVLCDNLPQIYYDKYRSPLDPTDFGFHNVLEMFSYLQHQTNEFYLIRDINRNGWAVTLLTHVDSTVSQNIDADSQSCTLQAGFMINNFKKILMNYQPITSNDLLIKYNMFYGRENGIQSLGFKSIEEFINSKLKSIIDVSKSKSTQFICLKSDFLHPTALPEAQEINDIMYSEDVCLIDDKLPPFVITFSHNLPTKVEFIVSDATNPDCFSMQLVSSYKVLDKLMTDLYYFYEENEADYLMCEEAITIDALCASTFAADDDWHRARIMAVYSETVLLDYVDYGSTFNQSKSKLRLLHKKFSKLPVQSIGAKQRGIKPPGNSFQWPSEVRYKLLQMFENSIVVAEVFSIDSKRSFLEVNLIHVGPENEETLFTNILVTRGLAEYSDLPDGNGEELDNIKRTVPTKRDLRSSNSTQRNTSYSESSNKSSIEDEKIPGTSYEYYTQERKESEYNSLSRSMTNSVEDILSRTMEQLEVSSQNEVQRHSLPSTKVKAIVRNNVKREEARSQIDWLMNLQMDRTTIDFSVFDL